VGVTYMYFYETRLECPNAVTNSGHNHLGRARSIERLFERYWVKLPRHLYTELVKDLISWQIKDLALVPKTS